MVNAGVEGFGRGVVGEPEDLAAPDAGQPTGAGDQHEAQGPHAAHDIGVGALTRARSRRGDGVELEAPGDVVGEDAELLPGAGGAVVPRGDDVERDSPLSSAIVFSWAPRPPMKA